MLVPEIRTEYSPAPQSVLVEAQLDPGVQAAKPMRELRPVPCVDEKEEGYTRVSKY